MLSKVPAIHPYHCFSERLDWIRRPRVVLAVAVLSAALVAAALYGAGVLVASQTTATVAVDNPDHPGEHFCENRPAELTGATGCEESPTIEREVSSLVRSSFATAAALSFGGFLGSWLLGGAVLHVAARYSDGIGTTFDTYAIAAWSVVPVAATGVLGAAVVAATLLSAGFGDAASGEAAADAVGEGVTHALPFVVLLGIVGATLQARIWYAGLVGLHHVEESRAGQIAGGLWVYWVGATILAA